MLVQPVLYLSIAVGALSMISYGFSGFLISRITRFENAIKAVFWYFLLMSIVLGIVGLLFFKPPQISELQAVLLALVSVFSVLGLVLFYKGLEAGKLAIVSPLSGTWSIVTVLISITFLGESLSSVQMLGVALTIAGTVLTSLKIKDIIRLKHSGLAKGSGYAIACALSWGLFYSGIGVLSKQMGWLWPILITGVGSAILLFFYSLAKKSGISYPKKTSGLVLAWVAIAIVALSLYGIGTSYGYVSVVSPISASAPVIAVVLALFVLKEKLEPVQVLGIAVIIIGLVMIAF